MMRTRILGFILVMLSGLPIHAQTAGIEGTIHYTGTATGTVFILAVTNLDQSDEEYEWGGEPLAGPFTNAYALTNMEAGIYYVFASMDTNDLCTSTDPWGHYAFWSNAPIAVTALAGQTTGSIDFELIDGSISNNPYADDDPEDNAVICDGTPFTCMPRSESWTLENERRIEDEYFFDSWIVRLDDGTYRLYANSPDQIHSNTPAFDSYHSQDGLLFTNEPGYRFEETGAFMPCVLQLSSNTFRCYYTDQSSRPNCDGEDCAGRSIKSAVSTNGGLDFITEGDCLVCDTNLPHEFKGVRGARVLELTNGTYRMYYHAIDSNSVWRILSASSSNGLSWTRDTGVRIDPTDYCPDSKSVRNFAPIIPFDGETTHLYITMSRCGEDWDNLQSGIFDSTSTNGLDFTVAQDPIVQNYFIESAYTGNPGEDPQAMPQDPTAILTTNGMRLYFGIYNGPDVLVNTSGIYSVICPDWDRDGMNDADELAAGTDPNDISSVLGIVSVEQDTEPGHACIIQWQSATGKTYRLQRASNMVDGFTTDVDISIPATPTVNIYTDSTAAAAGYYYYRIKLE